MDFDKSGRYRGEIVNCRKEGTGKYVFPGDVFIYDGPWYHPTHDSFLNSRRVDGEKHGKDANFSVSGYSDYEGDFLNGEMTGKGKKVWADGRTYAGDWVNGEMHGKGVWTSSDSREIYEGEFADNKREGSGSLCLRNGDRYNGQFHLHRFHGHGAYLRENVFFVEAEFQSGLLSGNAHIQWHKIATYMGECLENKLCGRGYFRSLDGSYEVDGEFVGNLPVFGVSGYDLKIDRSSLVEEAPDPKGKDKKKDKEKKKPAGKKGSSVVDVETIMSLSPGDTIGALSISLVYTGLSDSSLNLPNPLETRRALSLSLREFTPPAPADPAPDSGLGDVVSLWMRPTTLEERSEAWERFPPRSLRYVNGVNPLSGDRVALEAAPEFSSSHDPSEKVTSTLLSSQSGSSVSVSLSTSALASLLDSVSFVLDFKLTPSEALLSPTSPLRRLSIGPSSYLALVILSWGQDQATNVPSQSFQLSLLVPTDTTEPTWTGCLWELSLNESVVLSRWADSQSFQLDSWHSVGITLSGSGGEGVSTNLVVDGAGRVKVDKGEEESRYELKEFLSQCDVETERMWRVGGGGQLGFDGLFKSFVICAEYVSLLPLLDSLTHS
jgi:hypothetical protein